MTASYVLAELLVGVVLWRSLKTTPTKSKYSKKLVIPSEARNLFKFYRTVVKI